MNTEYKPKVSNAAFFAAGNLKSNWNSIFTTMDHWAGRAAPKKEVPPGMLRLAEEARYFTHKYEAFLSDVEIDPVESDEFDANKLRSLALEKVLEEWDTIRHALEQRENPRYHDTLVELDALARECFRPFFDEGKFQKGVFTYFHKLFDIKRFVFSNTPLIGAPFSALHAPEDWLAIPHEVGHFIFWNGTESFADFNKFQVGIQNRFIDAINNSIQGRIKGRPLHHKGEVFQVWLDWMNEIFADVFGTLVAGPAYAWSLQTNLRGGLTVRDLLHNHDVSDHPDPFLRPFFHIQVLREMAKEISADQGFASQLNTHARFLEESWRASWPGDLSAKLHTPDNIGTMENVISAEVQAVVSVILDTDLGENFPFSLREYFRKGLLYNSRLNTEALNLAMQIQPGAQLIIDSPLKKCIAARMAIVGGTDPAVVHSVLGYPDAEKLPSLEPALEQEFQTFIENVTGHISIADQLKAWRRVLNFSLREQDFHKHNHPHYH